MCLTAAVAQNTNYKQIDFAVRSKEAATIPGSPTWNIPPSHHASFPLGINLPMFYRGAGDTGCISASRYGDKDQGPQEPIITRMQRIIQGRIRYNFRSDKRRAAL